MKDPLKSKSKSSISYPSAIFALEKIGSFPFERFAYNALRRGIPALNEKGLNDSLSIDFHEEKKFCINAYISPKLNIEGNNIGYTIATNVYTPPILQVICKHFGEIFSDSDYMRKIVKTPKLFEEKILDFGKRLHKTYHKYNKEGFAIWIQKLFEEFDINISNFSDELTLYDLSSKFIVNHEVAHAYVGQLNKKYPLKNEDYRAFEYIVDMIAIDWLYLKWIRLTPDTDAYRKTRGFKNHKESIFNNAFIGIQVIMIILIFFGIARALIDEGKVSMESGRYHPNSFLRHIIHHTHFMTLVASNYGELLGDEIKEIDSYYSIFSKLTLATGFVNNSDIEEIKLSSTYQDFIQIPELVKLYEIKEFERYVPIVKIIKDSLIDQLRKK